MTEKKENNNRNFNQEQTAQAHARIQSKLAEKFTNIHEYITSQSNPSSQMSTNVKRKNVVHKRNYNDCNTYIYIYYMHKMLYLCVFLVISNRRVYIHEAERVKALKDKNGRRIYYEGRIELLNKGAHNPGKFRVFTDLDLGIKNKDQRTLQETVQYYLSY